ncbi:hypothetical protein CR513_40662, partial [Mucuna pruriens]
MAKSDEWKVWFDRASNLLGNGIEAILASLEGQYFPFLARLGFDYTNNMVEYEAYTMGITMAIEHQLKMLKIFGDLMLVIYQLRRELEKRDAKFIPYHNHIMEISERFGKIPFHYYHGIKEYLKKGAYPLGAPENNKRTLRRLATGFFLSGAILYKRSTDLTLLYYIADEEAKEIMKEVHEEAFGTHTNSHALAHKILRVGYY